MTHTSYLPRRRYIVTNKLTATTYPASNETGRSTQAYRSLVKTTTMPSFASKTVFVGQVSATSPPTPQNDENKGATLDIIPSLSVKQINTPLPRPPQIARFLNNPSKVYSSWQPLARWSLFGHSIHPRGIKNSRCNSTSYKLHMHHIRYDDRGVHNRSRRGLHQERS